MKRIISILAAWLILAAGLVSCDKEAKFSEEIPEHALENIIKSVTAVGHSPETGEEVEAVADLNGGVDNQQHTVQLEFKKQVDLSQITLRFEYAQRLAQLDKYPEEMSADLTNPITLMLSNLKEDVTYTISAIVNVEVVVTEYEADKTKMSAILGTYGDLPADRVTENFGFSYLVNGVRAEAWQTYGDWAYFGMSVNVENEGEVIPEEIKDKYSAAPIIDFGRPTTLAKLTLWPYWDYSRWEYTVYVDIYRYVGTDEIEVKMHPSGRPQEYVAVDPNVGQWENWEFVGRIDETEKSKLPAPVAGATDPQVPSIIEFEADEAPTSRYYRLKLTNRALYNHEDDAWNYRFALSEMDVTAYEIK